MEEDIEIIIQDFKDLICLFRHTDNITINKRSAVLFRKTLNLLTRYKQLEEENKNKSIKIIGYEKTLEKLQKETIWKSKVKEKIEEYKKNIDIAQGEELLILDSKVDVLQELLRKE